jgi:hypothetical protein
VLSPGAILEGAFFDAPSSSLKAAGLPKKGENWQKLPALADGEARNVREVAVDRREAWVNQLAPCFANVSQ